MSDREALAADYRRYLAAVVTFHLAAADAVGLGATDYQALNLLDLEGPLSGGELARRLGLTTGATTRLIDRLEAADVARRVPDPDDRRRIAVEATGRLPTALDDILRAVRAPIGSVIGALDAHQRDGLAAYLRGAGAAYGAAAQEIADRR
jgi:DNA-binding MarR family transcriptional regulator